jgi:cytoskeletal protein CcmA (bactofilin family)
MNSSTISHSSDTANIPAFLSKGESNRTVIGVESNFVGDISIREGQELHIEGCVAGNVFHGGRVVIAESGMVIGSVFASHVEVFGVVDAPDGEILAANLIVHGSSRINASEVTVANGCMNYERGGYMRAQMGMLPEGEVTSRIETLLQQELNRAQERRAAVEQARNAARDLRTTIARAPAVVAAPVAATVTPQVADEEATPAVALQATTASASGIRPAIALAPAIVDTDSDEVPDSDRPVQAFAAA